MQNGPFFPFPPLPFPPYGPHQKQKIKRYEKEKKKLFNQPLKKQFLVKDYKRDGIVSKNCTNRNEIKHTTNTNTHTQGINMCQIQNLIGF